MDFAQLEKNVSEYLTLADRGIIKLLCAAVIANRIPQLDPTWLFVVSSSSGGKALLPDHEVLTDHGWVFIKDIKPGDRVMAWNLENSTAATGQLCYAEVKGVAENDHDGPIYVQSHGRLNFKASPDHRWYVNNGIHKNNLQHKSFWRVVKSQELGVGTSIPAMGLPVQMDNDNYSPEELELIGWYIAEGTKGKPGMSRFSQIKKEGRDRIRFLLNKLGIKFYEYPKEFQAYWVPPFDCGNNCYEKFIPRPLLFEKHREALLSGLIQGDGSYRRGGWEYYTASKQLIDDVQELAMGLGWRTSISPKKVNYKYQNRTELERIGKNGKGMFPGHYVQNWRMSAYRRPKWILGKNSVEHYVGKTYCLWVPGPGTFVARYKGTPFITGNSELLLALSHAQGVFEQDDLTARAFISGMKSGEKETSLLFRLPENAIMVIKDLTVLLTKDNRESGPIFGMLRMIYDGKVVKSFGTGEDVEAVVRMGLIAGVTSVIEDFQADEAAVGQRAVKYYMEQPSELEVNRITESIIGQKTDRSKREQIGESFREFLDMNRFEDVEVLPELSPELKKDIASLSDMATKARSSVKRKQYSRDNPIERTNLREMPFRFAKQLANLAIAFMLMNNGDLTGLDKRILYKIALDSIPSSRRAVMIAATKFDSVTIDGLAVEMKLPNESVKVHLDDLVAHEIMIKFRGANKLYFKLREDYKALLARFENIEMTDGILDENDDGLGSMEPAPMNNAERIITELDM